MSNYLSYSAVRNPKWVNQAQTIIVCEVNFDHLPEEWVDFSCVESGDSMEHTSEIYQRCASGEFGEVLNVEIPTRTPDEIKQAIRVVRNRLLKEDVDPIVSNTLRWNSMTEAKQQEWLDYRQALLDLPNTSTATLVWNDDERDLVWQNLNLPTKPE